MRWRLRPADQSHPKLELPPKATFSRNEDQMTIAKDTDVVFPTGNTHRKQDRSRARANLPRSRNPAAFKQNKNDVGENEIRFRVRESFQFEEHSHSMRASSKHVKNTRVSVRKKCKTVAHLLATLIRQNPHSKVHSS
jgi:hypothetical protein